MARKPMVTRTIKSTKANVLYYNKESKETFERELVLPRTYDTDKALMKKVQEHDTDTEKAVTVLDLVIEEKLYGMSEDEFIAHAVILPPRSADDEADETETENNDKPENETESK